MTQTISGQWRRALLILAIAATAVAALQIANPGPASAGLVVTTGDIVVGQFASGDVAKDKINVEDSAGHGLRVISTNWCDNSAGGAVDCSFIEGTDGTLFLMSIFGSPPSCGPLTTGCGGQVETLADSYLDAADVHSKRFEMPIGGGYSCAGDETQVLHYRGQHNNIFMVSRFTESMSADKDRTTGYSGNYLSC